MTLRYTLAPFSLLLLVGCHGSVTTATTDEAVQASTYLVRVQDGRQTVSITGVVKPHLEADLSAQIFAPVAVVTKREGDHVRKGEVLVRLRAAALDAGVTQAGASLGSAEKQEAAAAAQANLAADTLNRYAQLRERHSVTAHELDQVKAQSAAALAQQQSAAALVSAARAAVAVQRANASDAVLYAPFDGVVVSRTVDPGAMAAPGVPLLHLQSSGSYDVEFSVPDTLLSGIHVGSQLSVGDGLGASATATIATIAPAGDASAHSFLIKASLPASSVWKAGTVVQLALSTQQNATSVLVPSVAIVHQGGLDAVLVVGANQIASVRYVTLGDVAGPSIAVLTGLRAGDRILSPGDLSNAGRRIEVRP